jgi:hypothetical protein
MRDAQDLEQVNAEGAVCVTDRTPPTRKYYTVTVELCGVNTGLIGMFSGWSQVLDYANNSVGIQDDDDVDSDYGVALEIWTGGRADDDCPVQTTDGIFKATTSGVSHGYLLFGANEFTMGNVKVDANISTFTLTGRTIALSQWGRGPYNVVPVDSTGKPGRLLKPLDRDAHFLLQRTSVAPPPATPGDGPVALDITGKFVAPNYYFGGPSNAPAAPIAPNQDASTLPA